MKAPYLDSAIVSELRLQGGKASKTHLCITLGASAWHIDEAIKRLRLAGKMCWTGCALRSEHMERTCVEVVR